MFGCSPKTIRRGLSDLANPVRLPEIGRIRLPGGGRNRILDSLPELDEQFKQVLQDHTAGDPMNADIKWTNLTHTQIAEHLCELQERPVSEYVAKQLLKKNKFVRRKARKSPHSDLQGAILTSHELVKTLLERATTSTGLQSVAHILDKVYMTGRKVADDFHDTYRLF